MQIVKRSRQHQAALVAAASLVTWQWTAAQQPVVQRPAVTVATVEQLDARSYTIEYQADAGTGEVSIFASASPDQVTSSTPVTTARTSPVRVSLPAHPGRVYFHVRPAAGPARVSSIRRLPLEGSSNFRDLGGYRTADGRSVRWGRLYRSDHLTNLTAGDYRYLDGLGIRVVCDLRTPAERTTAPTNWPGSAPEFLLASILSDADLAAARTPVPLEEFTRRLTARGSVASTATYERFVMAYTESYKQVMRRLIDGPVPAVAHCTAGRDRTGVYSAIVLTALGVPWDTVVGDYLLTNRYWLTDASIARRQKDYQAQYTLEQPPPADGVRSMMTLQPDTLNAAFGALTKRYGSFDQFLKDGLALSELDLAALEAKFLEP